MAPFTALTTQSTTQEIELIASSVKETFPDDQYLQSMSDIEIFNIFSTAGKTIPLDCLDDDISVDFIKALWLAHKAEIKSTGEHRGIESIENMENEDGKVEFYDLSKSSENSWLWVDQAETTVRGKELLSYFQYNLIALSIGNTTSDYHY